jgi:hypothetical protein
MTATRDASNEIKSGLISLSKKTNLQVLKDAAMQKVTGKPSVWESR